jgi:serine/threonine protein kinase/tetratricopeptide (TPR) repeat protein
MALLGQSLGPYRIEKELGSGGMGKVYAATVAGRVPGLEAGTKVALKVVHPHLLETPGFFKRFLREADIGKQVAHENVVRTYDADALAHDGVQLNFLVMEYVEGQTLRSLLAELERVPEELCRHIGREVAKGLAAIHATGVVHRDLKPENVLITPEHEVKLMDLGVARLADEAMRLSQSGAFVGSLHYAAPEQFSRAGEGVDHRADLHALGLVLYELACGRHPFDHEDMRRVMHAVVNDAPRGVAEINPQLSPFFEEVVHTLLAKDRGERFETAEELHGILEQGESSPWWKEHAKALRIETKQPLRRIHIPRETALYGRDGDLARLHKLFDEAKSGDGHVLLVEGEAGIGKTRLVDEFVGRLKQDGEDLNFLFGSYPPSGAATAAGAFSAAYREQFGSAGLSGILEDYLVETPLLIPAFAALLRGDAAPKDAEPLTKDSLQTVFVHATRALAAERTTIVLIDDLHFAPEDGRALFASLALAVPGHRILLVGTTRPGLSEEWVAGVERQEHASQFSLARLGPKDLIRLLKDAFRSDRLAEQLAARVAEKSDGNPFFVFEIIRGLREGQFITQREDGTWASTQVIDEIKIPSSVMDLVNARVADLDDEERNLLEVAACSGFEFDGRLVAEVLGMARIPGLQRLGKIEKKHRLVRAAGPRFAFDHHQVQEALYAGTSEALREEYHAAIAEALEAREKVADKDPKEIDGALAVELCEHFFKGVRGERGLRYLDAALGHLEAGYLNDSAIALADRALAVSDLVKGEERVDLLLRKAGRLGLLGRREAERAALDEAVALAENDGGLALRARVETVLGHHLYNIARYGEAREVLSCALDRAREAGDKKIEGRSTGGLGNLLLAEGRYEEARAHFEGWVALSRELGDRRSEAAAMGGLGQVSWAQGHNEKARDHFQHHLAFAREGGDRHAEASATGGLSLIRWSEGCHEEAREHFHRWLALAREVGDRRSEGVATGNLGNVFWSLGRCEESREHLERHLALAREIGDQHAEAIALVNLGPLFVALGRPDEGRERLRESLAICREIGARRVEGYALEELGAAAECLGDAEAAERLYREALALRREIGYPRGVATTLVALGALTATTGRADEAGALLREAGVTAREAGVRGARVLAACHGALLPDGDVAAAADAFAAHDDRLEHHEKRRARTTRPRSTAPRSSRTSRCTATSSRRGGSAGSLSREARTGPGTLARPAEPARAARVLSRRALVLQPLVAQDGQGERQDAPDAQHVGQLSAREQCGGDEHQETRAESEAERETRT